MRYFLCANSYMQCCKINLPQMPSSTVTGKYPPR